MSASTVGVPEDINRRNAKVFRAHAAPQGMCDNLISCAQAHGNQQKNGDSPVKMMVAPGLLKKSRGKMMDGHRMLVHCSGQLCCSKDLATWRKKQSPRKWCGQSSRQKFRELLFGKRRTSSLCVRMKREWCFFPSAPQM